MNYTPEQKEKWDKALSLIEESMESFSYNMWFKPLRLYAVSGETIYVLGNNSFTLQHLKTRYGSTLERALDVVFDIRYNLEYYTPDQISLIEDKLSQSQSTLNKKYTFDNFVVGDGNKFAYVAAAAVADAPSEAYNPLFIYGGVGLGKTHLLNAVGNYVLSRDPSKNVLLMTSEAMTNQLIEGIGKKNTAELRAKLRRADYLMVDDIQFLGKTRVSQEEFFNTFNDLRENHKQIIISSDRPPRELPEIEERLRSRFEWGLIVDIQKPDFETRMAILQQKAAEDGIDVPYEVLEYIARSVSSNIRELEGCLTSLTAYAGFRDEPVTLEMAQAVLSDRIGAHAPRKITPELIIEVVAGQHGLSPEDLTGARRSRDIAAPRQIAMYLCREMTGLSTTDIGRAFGNRDHTTVMHGCDKVSMRMSGEFAFRKKVDELMALVREQ